MSSLATVSDTIKLLNPDARLDILVRGFHARLAYTEARRELLDAIPLAPGAQLRFNRAIRQYQAGTAVRA